MYSSVELTRRMAPGGFTIYLLLQNSSVGEMQATLAFGVILQSINSCEFLEGGAWQKRAQNPPTEHFMILEKNTQINESLFSSFRSVFANFCSAIGGRKRTSRWPAPSEFLPLSNAQEGMRVPRPEAGHFVRRMPPTRKTRRPFES